MADEGRVTKEQLEEAKRIAERAADEKWATCLALCCIQAVSEKLDTPRAQIILGLLTTCSPGEVLDVVVASMGAIPIEDLDVPFEPETIH